jgi:DNA-binding transcriptional regulator YiaG
MWIPGRNAPQSAHDTVDEAKEAAQRDFDRRVSKCIFQTMKTAKGEEVSREAVDAFMESIGSKTVDIAKSIKVMRDATGMTQEQMAAAIGVAQSSVSKWEAGDEMPGADAFLKIQWVCTHGPREH